MSDVGWEQSVSTKTLSLMDRNVTVVWTVQWGDRCCMEVWQSSSCFTQNCSFDFQLDFAKFMNLLRNISSFLGLTSPTRDVKSIQEEESVIHSKDEAAEEIVAGRILMTDAIQRYGCTRTALRV
eukprot:scaffold98_cov248-Ochromonas_danica.AAC.4